MSEKFWWELQNENSELFGFVFESKLEVQRSSLRVFYGNCFPKLIGPFLPRGLKKDFDLTEKDEAVFFNERVAKRYNANRNSGENLEIIYREKTLMDTGRYIF